MAITANIWDCTFRHEGHSVLGKVPTRIRYEWARSEWNGTTLFVDGEAGPGRVRSVFSGRKVGWLHEPCCLHPDAYRNVDWDGLDMVLTYHQPFLEHPKARFLPYGGIWIPESEWGVREKSRGVSLLCGTKTATTGHIIRQAAAHLAEGQADLYGPRYCGVGYGADAKVRVLRDYRFSIITETCYEPNLFTEWLCDALAVGTIPVLWGCPNVGEFFNPDGIILWDTLEALQDLLPTLTEDRYVRKLDAVRDNAEIVRRYAITDDLVAEALA